MKKNKKVKTDSKKQKSLFGGAGKSLRKLGKKTGLGGLSTTQKVVGGAALLALGLGALVQRRGAAASAAGSSDDSSGAEQNLAAMNGGNI